jgi:hypothetical protein
MGIDYEYEHRDAEHEHGEAPEKNDVAKPSMGRF